MKCIFKNWYKPKLPNVLFLFSIIIKHNSCDLQVFVPEFAVKNKGFQERKCFGWIMETILYSDTLYDPRLTRKTQSLPAARLTRKTQSIAALLRSSLTTASHSVGLVPPSNNKAKRKHVVESMITKNCLPLFPSDFYSQL